MSGGARTEDGQGVEGDRPGDREHERIDLELHEVPGHRLLTEGEQVRGERDQVGDGGRRSAGPPASEEPTRSWGSAEACFGTIDGRRGDDGRTRPVSLAATAGTDRDHRPECV